MCQYKSATVLRDESLKGGFRLIMSPWTESHGELITMHKLRDDGRLRFARVEFSPPNMGEAHPPEIYTLRLDEERAPARTVRDGGTVRAVLDGGTVRTVGGGGRIVNDYRKAGK